MKTALEQALQDMYGRVGHLQTQADHIKHILSAPTDHALNRATQNVVRQMAAAHQGTCWLGVVHRFHGEGANHYQKAWKTDRDPAPVPFGADYVLPEMNMVLATLCRNFDLQNRRKGVNLTVATTMDFLDRVAALIHGAKGHMLFWS